MTPLPLYGRRLYKVPQLRAIYDHADEMPRKPGQGMPGDGEVPLNNIKLVLSTLVAFHIPTKARDEARLTRTRTSIYRHEAESLERVFGGDGNDENDKVCIRFMAELYPTVLVPSVGGHDFELFSSLLVSLVEPGTGEIQAFDGNSVVV